MQAFTAARAPDTADEIWLTEHPPVYTLGLAGRREHLLRDNGIPVLKVDRGGQVTYHGPGQLVAYLLIDIARRRLGVRQLVRAIEASVIQLLDSYGVAATVRSGAMATPRSPRWASKSGTDAAITAWRSTSTWISPLSPISILAGTAGSP